MPQTPICIGTQSDTDDLFGDGMFEDLIVNGTYTPMKTSGLKWTILQRLIGLNCSKFRFSQDAFRALRDVKPIFTITSGRKDGIVFMILLSGNLDDDTLAAEYTARTTT